jgi:hypothetical protein
LSNNCKYYLLQAVSCNNRRCNYRSTFNFTFSYTAYSNGIYSYLLISNKRQKDKISKLSSNEEKDILLKISYELKNNNLDEALFVESKMKANGDINKAEAMYIKERKRLLTKELSEEKIIKDKEAIKKLHRKNWWVSIILISIVVFLYYKLYN